MPAEPGMGGEDFGRYLQRVPGCFATIGGGAPACPLPERHGAHSPRFALDPHGLPALRRGLVPGRRPALLRPALRIFPLWGTTVWARLVVFAALPGSLLPVPGSRPAAPLPRRQPPRGGLGHRQLRRREPDRQSGGGLRAGRLGGVSGPWSAVCWSPPGVSLLYGTATTPLQLGLLRGVHGLAQAIPLSPGAFAVLSDAVPPARRAQAMGTAGVFIARRRRGRPLAGILADRRGPEAVFLAVALVLAAVALVVARTPGSPAPLGLSPVRCGAWALALCCAGALSWRVRGALVWTAGIGTLVVHLPLVLDARGAAGQRPRGGLRRLRPGGPGAAGRPRPLPGQPAGAPPAPGRRTGPDRDSPALAQLRRLHRRGVRRDGPLRPRFRAPLPAATALVADATIPAERASAFGVFYAAYSLGVVGGEVGSGLLAGRFGAPPGGSVPGRRRACLRRGAPGAAGRPGPSGAHRPLPGGACAFPRSVAVGGPGGAVRLPPADLHLAGRGVRDEGRHCAVAQMLSGECCLSLRRAFIRARSIPGVTSSRARERRVMELGRGSPESAGRTGSR